MSVFFKAFLEGADHILRLDALDHILYLLVLCACYDYSKSGRIIGLVTAFTIGHALTFILAASGYMPNVRPWAEMAIPVTIMITAIVNWSIPERKRSRRELGHRWVYLITIFFGAVHGSAIGSMLRIKIDLEEHFLPTLLGFNLGVELAQILVVIIILVVQLLLMALFRIKMNAWKQAVSGIAFGAAFLILLDNL